MSIMETIKHKRRMRTIREDNVRFLAENCDMGRAIGGDQCAGRRHKACMDCGQLTCEREMRIEEGTLRRRLTHICQTCRFNPRPSIVKRQEELRALRTSGDWDHLSDPIDTSSVIGNRMPEQYDSAARRALRAFVDSDFVVASIPAQDVATLQNSIEALGLSRIVYAETRDGETILRRI